jgi:hypothetical protein
MTDQPSPTIETPLVALEPAPPATGVGALLEVADARLAEISHLAARLGEVSGQAQVAALNLALELARDGGARAETENALAEEVRRLAERAEAVARRLPGIVERIQSAHRAALDRIAAPGAAGEPGAPAEEAEAADGEPPPAPDDAGAGA